MKPFFIRPLTEADGASGLKPDLKNPNAWILGALHGNLLIGYLDYRAAADEIQLIDIAVDANHRRQGVGMNLMQEMLRLNPQASAVYLEVRPSNSAALALYRKCGFSAIHTRQRYYSNGEDALVMVRKP